MKYPLAEPGIFHTIQGEGILQGLPMFFVRLAGCSIGCKGCDTNYKKRRSLTEQDIVSEILALEKPHPGTGWVWITGGEPTDHDLAPLFRELKTRTSLQIAMITAGTRVVEFTTIPYVLYVSPHSHAKWKQRRGHQLNIVPGLHGLSWEDVDKIASDSDGFPSRHITPLEENGELVNIAECVAWLKGRWGWRLGSQSHKLWGLA